MLENMSFNVLIFDIFIVKLNQLASQYRNVVEGQTRPKPGKVGFA